MGDTIVLNVQNLTKNYRGKTEPAVDNLSFQVPEGEIFGLLGPNGAGKTTTISVLCSLIKPTEGRITITGLDLHLHLNQIKSRIGVVGQDIALYEKLTAYENLLYFGTIYNIRKHELQQTINSFMHRLGLDAYKNQQIRRFSGGMKRRINLIAGVLHKPQLLFLDEPTVGVDVQTRNVIREFLIELKYSGTTIVYTSHLMDDAQKLCDRVCIIDQGRIIAAGSPSELIALHPECKELEEVFLKLTGRNLRDT
ncbi:MAG: ABC transporter ATP-binding protein [Anaerolineales bacterium]|jgi:ABC-2 type transport system ATP-binding protein